MLIGIWDTKGERSVSEHFDKLINHALRLLTLLREQDKAVSESLCSSQGTDGGSGNP